MTMDVFEGWPIGSAVKGYGTPKEDEEIIEGMFVKFNEDGELIKADATPGEKAFFSLDSQANQGSNKIGIIKGNAVIGTDQYDTGESYPMETDLMVDAGNPGKITPWVAATPPAEDPPVVGWSEGIVTRDGTDFLKINFPLKK